MPDRHGPLRSNRFLVEIDGIATSGFRRVDLPGSETRTVRYREGTDPAHDRNLWGGNEYSDLVLERGAKQDEMELYEWRKQVEDGKLQEARKAIAVQILDEEGAPSIRYEFSDAWPVRYEAPTLDAQAGGGVSSETIVVTYDEMQRTQ